MLRRSLAAAVVCAGFLLSTGTAAAAEDYAYLLVDPNAVLDTTAYVPGDMTMDPGGQPGAMRVYNHRDGRTITGTVWMLADPAAATAAVTQAQGAAGITNPKSEPVAVGAGGTYISGTSADGAQTRSLLSFTEGNAAATIAFAGPINDPAPVAFAIELAQAQDALIKGG